MTEPKRDDEPTMEEILASIRKIISEDEPEAGDAGTAGKSAAGSAKDSDGESEPMELTQLVSEDGSVVDLRAEKPAEPEPAEAESASPAARPLVPEGVRVYAELAGKAADKVDVAAEPEPKVESAPEPAAEETRQEADDEPAKAAECTPEKTPASENLISAEATAATAAAMSRLKDKLAAGQAAGSAIGDGSDKSLETLVSETMAPHLKSWLDRNLPELVERIVREEIAKLTKGTEGS